LTLASDRSRKGIDGLREYPEEMPHDRDKLMILATDRRNRMQSNGRPRIDLTDEEIERSTRTAMRLADASKSQAEARAGANTTLPA
jgi:hypothetical protein